MYYIVARPRSSASGGLSGFSIGLAILAILGAILLIGGIVALALIPLYISDDDSTTTQTTATTSQSTVSTTQATADTVETLVLDNVAEVNVVEGRTIVNGYDATEMTDFIRTLVIEIEPAANISFNSSNIFVNLIVLNQYTDNNSTANYRGILETINTNASDIEDKAPNTTVDISGISIRRQRISNYELSGFSVSETEFCEIYFIEGREECTKLLTYANGTVTSTSSNSSVIPFTVGSTTTTTKPSTISESNSTSSSSVSVNNTTSDTNLTMTSNSISNETINTTNPTSSSSASVDNTTSDTNLTMTSNSISNETINITNPTLVGDSTINMTLNTEISNVTESQINTTESIIDITSPINVTESTNSTLNETSSVQVVETAEFQGLAEVEETQNARSIMAGNLDISSMIEVLRLIFISIEPSANVNFSTAELQSIGGRRFRIDAVVIRIFTDDTTTINYNGIVRKLETDKEEVENARPENSSASVRINEIKLKRNRQKESIEEILTIKEDENCEIDIFTGIQNCTKTSTIIDENGNTQIVTESLIATNDPFIQETTEETRITALLTSTSNDGSINSKSSQGTSGTGSFEGATTTGASDDSTVSGSSEGSTATGSPTTGLSEGSSATGLSVRSTATGASDDSTVSGSSEGSTATGLSEGSPATGISEGSTATGSSEGSSEGSTATGTSEGSTATGTSDDSTVSGSSEGSTATGSSEGSSATGSSEGSPATGTSDDSTATAGSEGSTVS
ncbi:hypothetical protein BpHYR1_003458 [Brachionus plicatilis]|uniref:Uncharacterized protein n=1 Tax=Brachionus plicatilis TaxID=10195 RepID=A0A3M7TCA9_BRAPC|nr:hypothetical protein BpHYR1_003458 [Brachionus plicatilis]